MIRSTKPAMLKQIVGEEAPLRRFSCSAVSLAGWLALSTTRMILRCYPGIEAMDEFQSLPVMPLTWNGVKFASCRLVANR